MATVSTTADSTTPDPMHQSPPKKLVAVLANPSITGGERTANRVALAATLLGFDRCSIVNLFSIPSASSRDIASLGRAPDAWRAARAEISAGITEAEAILLGFGTIATSGDGKRHLRAQLKWLRTELEMAGHAQVWQVGERPRHPSRWHQYLSDRHGRTSGGTLEQRLEEALRPVLLNDVVWPP
ncbi:DUF1643 domain-containing protein [Microbacterium sp. 3H14]|uniref:DUF1643 domain-containing protein n=1 Tax=unclassified Microbacterium TaxID=2609290 RepID=UPI00106A61CD|nr:DUF1643 domain-containing protein [Microbacterium sp. 3H14]TFB17515.1 DUF1643 domain-containing protein [Microbacterium sp. 3H14]